MAPTRTTVRLADACETALAPLSFLLYRVTRFSVHGLLRLHTRMNPAPATRWQTLDAQAIARPFTLLALMTSAPRWNTHAIIAVTAPLRVRRTLRVHTATAAASAPSWTVVAHAEPTKRIVASIGPHDAAGDTPWHAVDLPPGTYRLALRYYHWAESVVLPAVEVDGVPTVPSTPVPADTNDFYHDLANHSSLLYVCLHAYLRALLRHRRWFSRSFVEREYLPAGNPQTTFHYGPVSAGTRLVIELAPGLPDTHDVYFTAYNRASFPVLWCPVTQSRYTTPCIPVNGTYLLRCHPVTPGPTGGRATVRVRTEPAAAAGESRPARPPVLPVSANRTADVPEWLLR